MRIVVLIGLLLSAAACSGPAFEYRPEALRPVISVQPAMNMPVSDAAQLWTDATGSEFAPTIVQSETCGLDADWCVVGEEQVADCAGTQGPFRGCTFQGVIQVQNTLEPWVLISTLAHELGHTLKLQHTHDGTLMDPNRPMDVRVSPEIDTETLAAFRAEYPL